MTEEQEIISWTRLATRWCCLAVLTIVTACGDVAQVTTENTLDASRIECDNDGICEASCAFGTDPDCEYCAANGTCEVRCSLGTDPDCIVPACVMDGGCDSSSTADADAQGDAGNCIGNAICNPACSPGRDPDCGGIGCIVDLLCNARCPAGSDPDCDNPCRIDGLCNPECSSDPNCAGTPACGSAPVDGAPCLPSSDCVVGSGSCTAVCTCGRREDGSMAWSCPAPAGSRCGGACPVTPPGLEGGACVGLEGENCAWAAESGICWTTCLCSAVHSTWQCATRCDCPTMEPTPGASCTPEQQTAGRVCPYGEEQSRCRSYQCFGEPVVWHRSDSC